MASKSTPTVAATGDAMRSVFTKRRKPSSLYDLAVRRKDLAVGLRLKRGGVWTRPSDEHTYVTPVHIETWFTVKWN